MPDVVGVIPPILYLIDAYERVYLAMNPHFRQLQARLITPESVRIGMNMIMQNCAPTRCCATQSKMDR